MTMGTTVFSAHDLYRDNPQDQCRERLIAAAAQESDNPDRCYQQGVWGYFISTEDEVRRERVEQINLAMMDYMSP